MNTTGTDIARCDDVAVALWELPDITGAVMSDVDVWLHADQSDRARFAAQVFTGTVEECWIFCGGIEPRGGYGRWRPPGANVVSTHRWSYVAHHGTTDAAVIRHECDVRLCVNPHHLLDGTQAQNIRDTIERGPRAVAALRIWPARSYQLRDAARNGYRYAINDICTRPEQLRLFPVERNQR